MNNKISVIVPVYNCEDYLKNCIDSILGQTHKNLELVLVDDGSQDKSGEICDFFSQKDDRVFVIHKENGGVSQARAAGLNFSSGSFVIFVDGDDSIPNNALEILLSSLKDSDIVVGRIKRDDGAMFGTGFYKSIVNSREWVNGILDGTIHSGPVAKLIKRDCISESEFNIPKDIVYAEDLVQNVMLGFKCNKISFINDVVYIYRYNVASVSHTFVYTIRYGEKLYNLINGILDKHEYDYRNFSYNVFCLNVLKHIALSGFYDNSDLFVKRLLKKLNSDIWFFRKNIIWFFILKYKLGYIIYKKIKNL